MKKVLEFIREIEYWFPKVPEKILADSLEEQNSIWWNELARNLGQTPPSDKTIKWVVFYFRNLRPSPWRSRQSLLFKRLTLFIRGIYPILKGTEG